jgi:hypothetical protein
LVSDSLTVFCSISILVLFFSGNYILLPPSRCVIWCNSLSIFSSYGLRFVSLPSIISIIAIKMPKNQTLIKFTSLFFLCAHRTILMFALKSPVLVLYTHKSIPIQRLLLLSAPYDVWTATSKPHEVQKQFYNVNVFYTGLFVLQYLFFLCNLL